MIMKRMMPMRYELYVDSLFFLNFIMNLYLLLLVDRSTLRSAPRGRLVAGAAAGAACTLLPFLAAGPVLLKLTAGIVVGAVGMLCITFPVRGFGMFLKLLERLVLYSFGMGGAMLFLIRLLPGLRRVMVSVPGILVMGGLFFPLYQRLKDELYTGGSLCRALLSKGGRTVETVALVDSGNSLIEPVSGKPVCVVGRELFDDLWGGAETLFRAIPYHSIGKRRGILAGYLLPGLRLKVGGMEYSFTDVYVAVSDEVVSGAGGAEAASVNMIINPGLFAKSKKGGRGKRQNERMR